MVSAVRNESLTTNETWLCMFSEKLRAKRFIKRQYTVQKIGAINSTARDGLNTGVFVTIIQQQTVTTAVVAAALQKHVDTFGLFRTDSYYNINPSFT